MLRTSSSPKKVVPTTAPALAAGERELQHGSHGVQGGERGNEYQALWMTLACLNALHLPEASPQVIEIILEGSREPFDDIELRRDNGVHTLFQSKHRDKAGSNNVTISELLALPDSKNGSAFSLAKYFHGMMKYIQTEGKPEQTRFIICVSANFSTAFETKIAGKKQRIALEEGTWSTDRILKILDANKIDKLFTQVYFDKRYYTTLAKINPNNQPEYFRFSDNFIEGNALEENQEVLRTLVFESIKSFIAKNNEEDWVTDEMKDDPEDSIKIFLRHLQLWINQPKLEALQEIVLHAIKRNFVNDVESIHNDFYEIIKATSNRKTLSLDVPRVRNYLKQARGRVLTQQVLLQGRYFAGQHFLGDFGEHSEYAALAEFLKKTSRFAVASALNPVSLKYQLFSTVVTQSFGTFGDDWCIIDAATKPLYDIHEIQGEVNHEIEDIFLASKLKLLIIDNATLYLMTPYGRAQLTTLAAQRKCKIILICHSNDREAFAEYFDKPPTALLFPELKLTSDTLNRTLGSEACKNKLVQIFRCLMLPVPLISQRPILLDLLSNPLYLADVIRNLLIDSQELPTSILAKDFQVSRYRPKPLPAPQPYYDLTELVKHRCRAICIMNIPEAEQQAITEIFETNQALPHGTVISSDKKHLYLRVRTGDEIVFVKRHKKLGPLIVTIEKVKKDINTEARPQASVLSVYASGFIEEKTKPQLDDFQQLLVPATNCGNRVLVAADYGSGKSSLLKQLFFTWMRQINNEDFFELVIPCYLTHIVHLVRSRVSLVEILIAELQRQQLLTQDVSIWFRAYLEKLLKTDQVLILFDQWDELDKTQYDSMARWLDRLPENLHFIVMSRWHAVPVLRIKHHQRLELKVFEWKDILEYIVNFFDNKTTKLPEVQYKKFKIELVAWLGNGRNKEVNDILEKPLHLALLVDALESFYDELAAAASEAEYQAINQKAPWHDSVLYRLKLYQLIVYQQLKKYIFEQVGARPITATTDINRVNMFTQLHQLKLRDIAFSLVFGEKSIPLASAIDENFLIQELYNLGILKGNENTAYEFVYRIFSEYFAAQYLLAGLMRGAGDPIYDFVIKTIRNNAASAKYEQAFRILGEMVRFGEPFLNFIGKGVAVDPLTIFPDINADDQLGFYYNRLRDYLSGKSGKLEYDCANVIDNGFLPNRQFKLQSAVVNENYQDKSLIELIQLARNSKDAAAAVVRHLIATGQLAEGWLQFFFHKEKGLAEHATENQLQKKISPTFANLANTVNTFKWPAEAWGGYWDIDAYLPSIKYIHPRVFLMGAAYFIHRVENKGNIYFDSQISGITATIITNLAAAELNELADIKLFFMMVLTWFKKSQLTNQFSGSILMLTGIMNKALQLLATEVSKLNYLAAHVLFSLFGVFSCRVIFLEDGFTVNPPMAEESLKFQLAPEKLEIVKKYFSYLQSALANNQFRVPPFELDGSSFVEPNPDQDVNEQLANDLAQMRVTKH